VTSAKLDDLLGGLVSEGIYDSKGNFGVDYVGALDKLSSKLFSQENI